MTPDAAQRRVIDSAATASGVVIGAPGTGKTATLVARVVRLIGEGAVTPDEVLALTPTRQAATGLRDRIGVRLPVATPGAPARSLGSFAFQVVRARAVSRGREPPSLLTGADQDRIIADLLAEDGSAPAIDWPASLSASVRASAAFRSELRVFLAECTELGVSTEELRATGDESWRAAADFIDDYREVLMGMRAAHRDAADLLDEAAAILAGADDAELGPLARVRVVLLDDAQELTRGGITLVRALRRRGVAVLAFGDPDISSGAFRGASPEHFAELAALLGEVHVLDEPHRQNPPLTALTSTLTQSIGAGGRIEHRRRPSDVEPGEAVAVHLASSPYEEADRIAGVLRDWHLSAGVGWEEMAVIAHDTRQITALEAELAAREVPTRAAGVPRPLGSESVVRDIAGVIRLALTPPAERDPEEIAHALRSPFGGLDAVGLRRLRARLRQHELALGGGRSAKELLREAMSRPGSLAVIDAPEARAAERLAETLAQTVAGEEAGESAHELLWRVWDRARSLEGRRLESSWRQAAEQSDAEISRALDALVALFDAAKRFGERSPDESASLFLREILDSEVPEDTLSAPERPGVVTLLTPATALGAEFEAVVIAGVQEGVWPNVRLRGGLLQTWRLADGIRAAREGISSPEIPVLDRRRGALHDELRLFVRAVSRARSRLVVTATSDDDQSPSPFFAFLPDPADPGAHPAAEHPLTLRGLVARHRRTLTTATTPAARAEAAEQLMVLAREGVPGAAPEQWYGILPPSTTAPLIDTRQQPVRVSPSRMEGFEACALDWVIRRLGGDTSSAAAGLGTVLHAAMEAVPSGGREELRRVVEEHWGELEFEADWLAQKERRRAEVLIERLDRYLEHVGDEGGRVLHSEAGFELEIDGETDEGPRVVLAGAIDRVEAYPPRDSEESERVVIVDLKTGRNEDRYLPHHVTDHAQLAAYQLAFREGAIAGAEGGVLGGSRLVLIGKEPRKNEHFYIAHQQPYNDDARRAFLVRIIEDARGMAAAEFLARIDTHCLSDTYAVCHVHTIKAVSAS